MVKRGWDYTASEIFAAQAGVKSSSHPITKHGLHAWCGEDVDSVPASSQAAGEGALGKCVCAGRGPEP